MGNIKDNVKKVFDSLKDYPNVQVIAATKYVDVKTAKELIDLGIKHLGENRTDAFLEKYESLKDEDVTWHFFGVLQTRKVRGVVEKLDYLHSLDSLSLASEINKRRTTPLNCFVQVNVSNDPNKSGLDESKVLGFIKSLEKYPMIRVVGLMTITRLTFNEDLLESYFLTMKDLQTSIQNLNLQFAPCTELSMGMSNDYLIAVKNGATFVRLGRILFN